MADRTRFSLNKSSAMHEKRKTPRSCLRWIPTGRIFKLVGLRWIPTGKMLIDSTTKVDSEPPNGSNEDITNPYEFDQTLNVSAGTLNLSVVQASLFNDKITHVHISSSLALQRHMASADNTSGLVPQSKERFESLRGSFPSRWESVGLCPIDVSIRGWQGLPSGSSKKQHVVSCSSGEAEYKGVANAVDEAT
ncbi:hypothetical protein Tco_1394743 [Tanacetum coccineum]